MRIDPKLQRRPFQQLQQQSFARIVKLVLFGNRADEAEVNVWLVLLEAFENARIECMINVFASITLRAKILHQFGKTRENDVIRGED